MEKDKVYIKIKIPLNEKLSRDMDRTMVSYHTLNNKLKSLIKVHRIPSIREPREIRSKEEVKQEITGILDLIKQAIERGDLEVAKEVIT